MLVKTILIFLLAMVLVGMIGKVLFSGTLPRLARRKPAVCPRCSRPLIGKSCTCRTKA